MRDCLRRLCDAVTAAYFEAQDAGRKMGLFHVKQPMVLRSVETHNMLCPGMRTVGMRGCRSSLVLRD